MYPSFRGRKLDKPNFPKEYIEEIGFLIGNKKNEETTGWYFKEIRRIH